MAKKSRTSKKRKQRKPNIPTYAVPVEKKPSTAADAVTPSATLSKGASPVAAAPLASSDATTESIDWAAEYPFFAPDMKRLGIIVLLMVILLLAMNLVFIYLL